MTNYIKNDMCTSLSSCFSVVVWVDLMIGRLTNTLTAVVEPSSVALSLIPAVYWSVFLLVVLCSGYCANLCRRRMR